MKRRLYYVRTSRGGGTGRRRGLKIPRLHGHVGSTPSPGTIRLAALRAARSWRAGQPTMSRMALSERSESKGNQTSAQKGTSRGEIHGLHASTEEWTALHRNDTRIGIPYSGSSMGQRLQDHQNGWLCKTHLYGIVFQPLRRLQARTPNQGLDTRQKARARTRRFCRTQKAFTAPQVRLSVTPRPQGKGGLLKATERCALA